MENEVQTAELWIFRFMCGFALFSSISIAIQNIFFILSLLCLIYRLYLKHDDIKEALTIDKGLLYPFLAWAGGVVLSCIASAEPIWSFRVFGDYFGYRTAGLFIVLIAIREKKLLISLLKICFASLTIAGVICVYSFTMTGQRTGGTVPIMSLAGVLSMLVPMLFLGVLLLKEKQRIICIIGFVFVLAITIINGTRGAWLAIIVAIGTAIMLIIKSWKKRIGFVLAGCLVIGVLMMVPSIANRAYSITNFSSNRSNMERIYLWQSATNMFKDHPVFGVGFGRFKTEYQGHYILPVAKNPKLGHAHSNVMQMVGECGAVGTVTFIGWWLLSTLYVVRKWFSTRNFGYIAFFVIFTGLLLQGLTEYNLGNSLVSKLFWFLLAGCLQWMRIAEESRE